MYANGLGQPADTQISSVRIRKVLGGAMGRKVCFLLLDRESEMLLVVMYQAFVVRWNSLHTQYSEVR